MAEELWVPLSRKRALTASPCDVCSRWVTKDALLWRCTSGRYCCTLCALGIAATAGERKGVLAGGADEDDDPDACACAG